MAESIITQVSKESIITQVPKDPATSSSAQGESGGRRFYPAPVAPNSGVVLNGYGSTGYASGYANAYHRGPKDRVYEGAVGGIGNGVYHSYEPSTSATLGRQPSNGSRPGAAPAFVSATATLGLRRTHPNSAPVAYRSYSSPPPPPTNGLPRFNTGRPQAPAPTTQRRPSNGTAAPPNGLIWSAAPNGSATPRPTVVLRKPRSRRLLRSLLCCFGVKPTGAANGREAGAPLKAAESPASPYLPKPSEKLLLPPLRACDSNKKCLIIDLDETLVHSSFKPVKNADFVIPVEIDGVIHQVYVLKRPYVDEFLDRIGDLFECILFTASLAKYADPVADLLDKRGVFRSRLFREACVFHKGNYVKDLNRLGRDLKRVLIVDNSPASYAFHPDNAIPVQSWFDDMSDTELLDLLPILERMVSVDNVYSVLRNANDPPEAPRP